MPLPVSAQYPKFTTEELYSFINEYERHPILYDFDHPLYTNYVERTRHFELMAKALNIEGLTGERVRAKIKVFRGNYTHRLKDFYKREKNGEPFSAPQWWFLADKFLRPHIRFLDPDITDSYNPSTVKSTNASEAEVYFGSDMPVSSTIEVIETMNEEEIDDEQHSERFRVKQEADSSHYADNSIYLELDDEQLMAIENGEISIEDVTARAEAAANQHQQQLAAARLNEQAEEVEEEEDDGTRSRMDDEGSEAEDEFDAFGRCVALKLRTLPLDTALELESQIHTLITRKRMTLLKQNKRH